jgi:hypothetical protein
MKRLIKAVRRPIAAAAFAVLGTLAIATPAVAATDKTLPIRGTATCDREASEYVVTWTFTNPNTVAGTIGNVRAYPADRSLVGLSSRIMPGETIAATQRFPGAEHSGRVILDVNWDDGEVGYNYWWPVHIKFSC